MLATRVYKSYPELQGHILRTVKAYPKLTVRQLYYILVSKFKYEPGKKFYKILDWRLVKLRKQYPILNEKFRDPSRHFIKMPYAFEELELWVEKDSVRNFLEPLAVKYRVSIQVLRGFASLSMYVRAIQRAKLRGVKRILYIGDHDPSGLLIDRVAEREMGIEIKRVALTLEQAERYRLRPIPVNRKDSRAEAYMKKFGDRGWEVEALRPRTFQKIVEQKLQMTVPEAYLREMAERELAEIVVKPVIEELKQRVVEETTQLLREGKPKENILKQLAAKFGIHLRKRNTGL